jgi:hypothetical protein
MQTFVQRFLKSFVQWCYYSKDYAFVRDSKYAIPLLQSLHLLGISLLLGTTVILNLRLLGLGFRRIPMPALADELMPWMKTGLGVAVVSGVMVFLPDPTRYAASGPFLRKMVVFCLALLYHFTIFRRAVRVAPETRSRAANIGLAAGSLVLWFGVGWLGRAIAFF